MGFDNGFDNAQPQSGADDIPRLGVFDPVEFVEDVLQVFFGHSKTVVLYLYAKISVLFTGRYTDF